MEACSAFNSDEISNTIKVISFIINQGGLNIIDSKINISNVDNDEEKKLIKLLKTSVLSLCNNFVKKHKENIIKDKLNIQRCGMIKTRQMRLAQSGLICKQIENASPLLIGNSSNNNSETTVLMINEEEDTQADKLIEDHEVSQYQHMNCYICKKKYNKLHFFYHKLCQKCGDFNYSKRNQSVNLTGKVAIVTGARVKIGYHIALKLLRAGCYVIATTRFPNNAAARYVRFVHIIIIIIIKP